VERLLLLVDIVTVAVIGHSVRTLAPATADRLVRS
jgi:hypothetical protein